jgi:hypothetical protein
MELNNAQLDAEVIALDARRNGKQRTPLLIHSKNFIADFAPPDYLIEGIARKRFLYSFTGHRGEAIPGPEMPDRDAHQSSFLP